MTKPDLGLPSAIKDSTQQQDRERILIEENLRLRRQRTKDLEELGEQKDLIIDLYSRLNAGAEVSPLTIAG